MPRLWRPRPGRPGAVVVAAPITSGFILPDAKVAVLSETDVTGRRMPHRRARPRARAADGFFDDLESGSFVVHRQHGVARFEGVTTRTMGGTTRDYLILQYRGCDRLYLPVEQIEAITPYSGGESPTLSKMGGADWQRHPCPGPGRRRARWRRSWWRSTGAASPSRATPSAPTRRGRPRWRPSFPFVETADQLRAIADVKARHGASRGRWTAWSAATSASARRRWPCGPSSRRCRTAPGRRPGPDHAAGQPARPDLRRPLRAVPGAGRAAEPVPVPGAAEGQVVQGLADGSVDVVVGTHRLLGQDVQFKELGLLVVDEEQRFGVSHKEAVKRMAEGVDVLTLTASPIPRTLEMALTGIRDLSMVNTPPADRRPILTYVGEFDDAAACSEAIRRELLREGQAFYVHNRVQDIEPRRRARSATSCPEARVAVAHGQMDEGSLETVVLDFWERRYDVLVCTTIIESGIDMPSVNTLIVDRADLLGLGQLHQIRGRVGRGGQRAYAYLFHPADRVLVRAGLRAAAHHRRAHRARLGLQDRHARPRDPRGRATSWARTSRGTSPPSGYDLYVQLVAEAVAEPGARPGRPRRRSRSTCPGDAHLPKDYVAAEDARLEAYRRLASAASTADVDDIGAEWADRYGPLPGPAQGLLAVARLRASAMARRIGEITMSSVRPGGADSPWCGCRPSRCRPAPRCGCGALAPGATYREDLAQLLLPIAAGAPAADTVRSVIEDLVPVPDVGPVGDTL